MAEADGARRTVTVTARGRVQGVYFRGWTVSEARERGLDGWVRNRRDGTVEAVLSGEPAAVGRMIELMRRGPADARVDGLDIREEKGAPPPGFEQRNTV